MKRKFGGKNDVEKFDKKQHLLYNGSNGEDLFVHTYAKQRGEYPIDGCQSHTRRHMTQKVRSKPLSTDFRACHYLDGPFARPSSWVTSYRVGRRLPLPFLCTKAEQQKSHAFLQCQFNWVWPGLEKFFFWVFCFKKCIFGDFRQIVRIDINCAKNYIIRVQLCNKFYNSSTIM